MPQKKRKTKTSKHEHGGGGVTRLSAIQKVLIGGGALASFKPVGHLQHGPANDAGK